MKKILVINCLALFSVIGIVQGQVTFEKTFGTNGDNFANDVRLTSDGGFIIVGTANLVNGAGDIFLIKTNASGDTAWTRMIGGAGLQNGNSVVQTEDGGYMIAGSTSSFGAGSTDAYLVKTDANGSVSWNKTYGTTAADAAYGIVQTSDGGYVFSGTEKQSGVNGSAHLVKVDASGVVLWSKTFGASTRKNYAYTLLQTADKGFVIGGWENLNLGVNDDFCLIKTDSNGTKLWYKSYGVADRDQNYSVHQALDGGFIIAGITFNASIFEVNVVKTDADGNLAWTRNVGGTGPDGAYAVTATSDGGFVFCGFTSSFGSMNQGYVGKLDGSGNLLWSKMMSGIEWNGFYAIHETNDGGLILAGAKDRIYGVSGSLYLVKTDAEGNSGCNTTVTSSISIPSIFVGTNVAIGTSTQIVNTGSIISTRGTSINTICSSCTPTTWFRDSDADGFGDPLVSQSSCIQPDGYVAGNTDCNDANGAIHPGAADVCNSIDDNCNGVIDENAIAAVTDPSGSISFCHGTTQIIAANNEAGISYQWFKNGNAIAGATNYTYSPKKSATYYVGETNDFGCTSNSAPVSVTVLDQPTASIIPLGNLDICQTGSVQLQANSGAGFTYQWKKGSNILAGATNQIYTATAKGNYRVIVTNSSGCTKGSLKVTVTKSCRESYVVDANSSVKLSCYPNPASDQFIIDLKSTDVQTESVHIEIANSINQIVYQEDALITNGELRTEVNTANFLRDGFYVVRVIAGDKIYSGNVMIQR